VIVVSKTGCNRSLQEQNCCCIVAPCNRHNRN